MIHLLNPLWNAYGGSERRALALYELLRGVDDVLLWSEHAVHPDVRLPVRPIRGGDFPRGGTLVVVGVYFPIGAWIASAEPERAIVVYNTPEPRHLDRLLGLLGSVPVEIVYASEPLRRAAGLPGVVQPSPLDLAAFAPAVPGSLRPFTVGRLSRDVPEKHHPADPALYARLAGAGARVRVMGGTCLPEVPGLERLPSGAEPAVDFLRSLDAFFYRTSERWFEAYGRVVFEAMACGLPVVAERRHGYAGYLTHGRDALLFEREAEAVEQLRSLREDPALRAAIGAAARRRSEEIYDGPWRERTREFYAGAGRH